MEHRLTEAENTRIAEAVAAAESRTSGEIVPYVVRRSDSYEIALWRGATLSALLALLTALMIFQFYEGWGLAWLHTGWGTALLMLVAATAGGAATALIRPLKRLLAGSARLTRTVHLRAMQAFVEEEVFATRERTGILIYISLFEHRIEVLGDSGINQRVTADAWADVVERIRDGIKSGKFVDGLIEAIGMCGNLLEKKGVHARPDDVNELPDAIRTRKSL